MKRILSKNLALDSDSIERIKKSLMDIENKGLEKGRSITLLSVELDNGCNSGIKAKIQIDIPITIKVDSTFITS